MRVNSAMAPLLIGLGLTAIHLRYCILRMRQNRSTQPWSRCSAKVPQLIGLGLTAIHLRYSMRMRHEGQLGHGPSAHWPGSDCYSP
jgi:hypothetical protein